VTHAAKYSAWLHSVLAAYLWIVASVPLGNWNRQRGERLLIAILKGQGIGAEDVFTMIFLTLPAVFAWLAYKRHNVWFAGVTLLLDVVWLWLQIQSWWIPYVFGAKAGWQIEYAQGPTTKILPSFGNHVAPDGMHFAIHILLVAAMITGVFAVRRLAAFKTASRQ
jgi:hypothetical protein